MKEIAEDVERWRARGERVAIATVVATRRSAPRPVGAKLAVSESGELCGSVSGGCVESDVYLHAREVLAGGEPRLLSYGISDDEALGVGLPCGGEIDVFVEELRDGDPAREPTLTVVAGDGVGERLDDPELARAARGRGRSHAFEHEGRTVYAEVDGPPPTLVVVGAVDTAEALCAAARAVGWHTICVDARAAFATPERIPSAHELVVAWPEEALARIPLDRDTAVVTLAHDDRFDLPTLTAALRSDAFYVGAIGSRRTQERRRERLLEAGLGDEELARVHGPVGLDIGAETPAETALAILAEALAVRAGRDGRPLRDAATRIHVER